MFLRKRAGIERAFEEFLGCLECCGELFATGMVAYLEYGPSDSLERSVELINSESGALSPGLNKRPGIPLEPSSSS